MTENISLSAWVRDALGHDVKDESLFERALTHGSTGGDDYQRLEFLGDRVLGMSIAAWLYERFSSEPEGDLSARLNAVVSRETCADVGRELGVPAKLRLGRQARDDGAQLSDNVVGDATEALIGAIFLEAGFDRAADFVRRAWSARVDRVAEAPKHPKSQLQEWAAARRCRPPVYTVASRDGPEHAPRFTVTVEVGGKLGGSASAEGTSKQEAETAAAVALLEKIT